MVCAKLAHSSKSYIRFLTYTSKKKIALHKQVERENTSFPNSSETRMDMSPAFRVYILKIIILCVQLEYFQIEGPQLSYTSSLLSHTDKAIAIIIASNECR